ncbi:DUF5058 family protein [Agromyces seonyuensis]|uniref:DUF5058 family protein n=1 Tax=Agromyces seonyuensis TaxID=2662446 RepID=A0A6I4NZY6_9MICO|nr:DUF5058 family protein [Agromyces seonyuensis]MWB97319.1 DUF5058 family protein [Agromyces seonyuensis]
MAVVHLAAGELHDVAFHPVLWGLAVAVFAVIILQSTIYLRAIRRSAEAAELTQQEVSQAVKTGAIAAIGPSLAVALVALSLLPLFGTPAVLARIGLVGSAPYDVAAAGIGASTVGASLGGDDYTAKVFAISFASMCVLGVLWMTAALIITPLFNTTSTALRKTSPKVGKVLSIAPLVVLPLAFAFLIFGEVSKSPVNGIVLVASAIIGGACLLIATKWGIHWLREWGLGIAIFGSLLIGAGVAAAA